MSQQSDRNLLFGEALRQQILIGILQLLDYSLAHAASDRKRHESQQDAQPTVASGTISVQNTYQSENTDVG